MATTTEPDLLLLMFQAWVRDINDVPFPTIEALEGQTR